MLNQIVVGGGVSGLWGEYLFDLWEFAGQVNLPGHCWYAMENA